MENVSNISSEEELLQLHNEGKINEAEYQDLLDTMRKPSPNGDEDAAPEIDKVKSKRKLGKIAFYLMLAGIVVPIVIFFICFAITGGGDGDVIFRACYFLCILIEIPAFVFGVISWPDVFGKATVASISVIAAIVALLWIRSAIVVLSRILAR